MSQFTDWFSPIKNAWANVEADWDALLTNGATQQELMKLGADINAGVVVTENQIVVGAQAVAIAINAFIPKVQQGLAEAQALAVAYPQALPWIVGIESSLTLLQQLDSTIIATNPVAATVPDGLAALIAAGEALYAFDKNLLAVAKR